MFDENIEALLKELENLTLEGRFPNIDRETAEYVYKIVMENKPMNIVEVGACNGYSTIWFALAAKQYGGKVTTFEWGADRCSYLTENIKRSGLGDFIEVKNMDATIGLSELTGIDLAFIDATKFQYIEYIKLIEPILRDKGMVIADNIVSHSDKLKDYIEYVKNSTTFDSEIVDLGTGLMISKKV